ncbi:MAG: hypothetical protein HOP29_03370 [Phycisphaerales bacterium]|nr:hypothetical protein [Phycisphaerales bacterium]
MFSVHVLCDPGEMEFGGIDESLDRIAGRIGADGVTVVAAGRPTAALRRGDGTGQRIVRSGGGLYFKPNADRYARTRCKPRPAHGSGSRDAFTRILMAAGRRELSVRALIDTRWIGRLAARDPSIATQSACGDVSPRSACVNHPDVAALLRALIADLADRDGVRGIVLRGLERPFDTDLLDNLRDVDGLGTAARELFGVCFCPSCAQSAAAGGVDVDAARRVAQSRLASAIDAGPTAGVTLDDWLGGNADLLQYLQNQRSAHVDFIRSLLTGAECDMAVTVDDSFDPAAWTRADTRPLSTFNVIARSPRSDGGAPDWSDLIHRCRGVCGCEAMISSSGSPDRDPAYLVRTMKYLADVGVNAATLNHFGVFDAHATVAARRAVRYASRTSTA